MESTEPVEPITKYKNRRLYDPSLPTINGKRGKTCYTTLSMIRSKVLAGTPIVAYDTNQDVTAENLVQMIVQDLASGKYRKLNVRTLRAFIRSYE